MEERIEDYFLADPEEIPAPSKNEGFTPKTIQDALWAGRKHFYTIIECIDVLYQGCLDDEDAARHKLFGKRYERACETVKEAYRNANSYLGSNLRQCELTPDEIMTAFIDSVAPLELAYEELDRVRDLISRTSMYRH